MDGKHGLMSWQWLFLIEGIPTMVWGVLIWCFLPRLPENEARNKSSIFFRSEEERRLILQRSVAGKHSLNVLSECRVLITKCMRAAYNTLDSGIKLHQVLVAFKDPKSG
jgi:hypothetical protein